MKKKLLSLLAVTAIAGVPMAFAANPFSDVTPNDWAYQSVSQLASSGIINGYPDGTFKGQNNITRFEMAQMVAKAMANQNRANAEQQAMINRLADEFSSELNNLGVRVKKLENQVGNLTYSGDAWLRYRNGGPSNINGWDYRVRMQFQNKVNDTTSVTARVAFANTKFGNTGHTFNGLTAGDGSAAYIDRAFVTHNFGKNLSVEAGRTLLFIGRGLVYNEAFDGAKATVKVSDKLRVTGAYGYPMNGADAYNQYKFNQANMTIALAQIDGKISNNVNLSTYYMARTKSATSIPGAVGAAGHVVGIGADGQFGKIWIGGEYAKGTNELGTGGANAWIAGVGYGVFKTSKPGSWDLKVQYLNEGIQSPVIWAIVQPAANNYKSWVTTFDYALSKNVALNAYYYFNSKKQNGTDVPDYVRAQLVYTF